MYSPGLRRRPVYPSTLLTPIPETIEPVSICGFRLASLYATMGGVFEWLGFSFRSRTWLFYGVCLPIRLALGIAVGILCPMSPVSVALTVLIVSIVISLNNGIQRCRGVVWWNRGAHSAIAALTALASIAVLEEQMQPWLLGLFVGFNPVFGFFDSLFNRRTVIEI